MKKGGRTCDPLQGYGAVAGIPIATDLPPRKKDITKQQRRAEKKK